jgi:hypothetical protein
LPREGHTWILLRTRIFWVDQSKLGCAGRTGPKVGVLRRYVNNVMVAIHVSTGAAHVPRHEVRFPASGGVPPLSDELSWQSGRGKGFIRYSISLYRRDGSIPSTVKSFHPDERC